MSEKEPEWWRMLDWNKMKNAWILLSDDIKDKVREAGLAPEEEKKS